MLSITRGWGRDSVTHGGRGEPGVTLWGKGLMGIMCVSQHTGEEALGGAGEGRDSMT